MSKELRPPCPGCGRAMIVQPSTRQYHCPSCKRTITYEEAQSIGTLRWLPIEVCP